jgi:hypothetical protein
MTGSEFPGCDATHNKGSHGRVYLGKACRDLRIKPIDL